MTARLMVDEYHTQKLKNICAATLPYIISMDKEFYPSLEPIRQMLVELCEWVSHFETHYEPDSQDE